MVGQLIKIGFEQQLNLTLIMAMLSLVATAAIYLCHHNIEFILNQLSVVLQVLARGVCGNINRLTKGYVNLAPGQRKYSLVPTVSYGYDTVG